MGQTDLGPTNPFTRRLAASMFNAYKGDAYEVQLRAVAQDILNQGRDQRLTPSEYDELTQHLTVTETRRIDAWVFKAYADAEATRVR